MLSAQLSLRIHIHFIRKLSSKTVGQGVSLHNFIPINECHIPASLYAICSPNPSTRVFCSVFHLHPTQPYSNLNFNTSVHKQCHKSTLHACPVNVTATQKYILEDGNKVAQTEMHSKKRILQDTSTNQCIKFICTPSHKVPSFKTVQIYSGTVTP